VVVLVVSRVTLGGTGAWEVVVVVWRVTLAGGRTSDVVVVVSSVVDWDQATLNPPRDIDAAVIKAKGISRFI
jgi:hypothetical protein